jgi:hypothetical protein
MPIDDLAILTGQEVLNNSTRTVEQVDPLFQRSWRTLQSDLSQYSQLLEGQGYTFNAIPNPVTPIAHAKSPLLPMVISIIPPAYYPTGQTRTIAISAPQTAPVQLEGFTESVRRRELESGFDPRNPNLGSVVARTERIINATPNTLQNVEVPVNTPAGQESQVRRTQQFLQDTHARYATFQQASVSARSRLQDAQSEIVLDRAEIRDTQGQKADVNRARQQVVGSDLDNLRQQAERLLDLPPLLMYVNPSSMSLSHDFIVSDGNRSREGYIVEFWGQQQPKLQLSGEIGAFWTHTTNASGKATGGLSVRYRRGSFAYQNFMQLFQTYKSNGYLYTQDTKRIGLVGSVNLFYDGTIYTGSFDTLTITHSEDKPFTLSYQIGFTVRYVQDLQR